MKPVLAGRTPLAGRLLAEKAREIWKIRKVGRNVGQVVANKSLEDPWVWDVVKHFALDVLDRPFWMGTPGWLGRLGGRDPRLAGAAGLLGFPGWKSWLAINRPIRRPIVTDFCRFV